MGFKGLYITISPPEISDLFLTVSHRTGRAIVNIPSFRGYIVVYSPRKNQYLHHMNIVENIDVRFKKVPLDYGPYDMIILVLFTFKVFSKEVKRCPRIENIDMVFKIVPLL